MADLSSPILTGFISFMHLFLAVLGLPCHTRILSRCGERQLLSVAVLGSLTAAAALVSEHRF